MKWAVGDEIQLNGPFTWHAEDREDNKEWDRKILAINPLRIGKVVSVYGSGGDVVVAVNYGNTHEGNLRLLTDNHLIERYIPITDDEVNDAIKSIIRDSNG